MSGKPFGIGIIGVQPGRSWAARAHIPALQMLSDYEIVGIANSNSGSGEAAAAALGLPNAFPDVHSLLKAPEIDIVAVTVKVPHHFELVTAALEAGKHVYCEWPLGNGLTEAEQLARAAESRGLLGVVGTQARVSPAIAHLRTLIADGYVGEVLSTTLVGRGLAWGGNISDKKTQAYLLDAANGATLLTIPVGHTLAALQEVLGPITEIFATTAVRCPFSVVAGSGEMIAMSAPDQVVVGGMLAGGIPLALHYRGGAPRDGQGLFWEISGTEGELRVTAAHGHTQMADLSLHGARGDEKVFQPIPIPDALREGWPEDAVPANVARMYATMASDLKNGTRTAPSFDDGVVLHRVIAAIEKAAVSGAKIAL